MSTSTGLRILASAMVLAATGACSSPDAPNGSLPSASAVPESEGDGVRRSPVVAGRPARVFVMAGFGAQCENLPAPAVTVTAPPSKGAVSFTPGQETTVTTSASGTCLGRRVTGTGIYYTARADESGPDRFTVRAVSGPDVTERTFQVEIVP